MVNLQRLALRLRTSPSRTAPRPPTSKSPRLFHTAAAAAAARPFSHTSSSSSKTIMSKRRQQRSPSASQQDDDDDDVLKHPPTKRAKEIDAHPPLAELLRSAEAQRAEPGSEQQRNVLHWFRSKDLRAEDNRALSAASRKARERGSSSYLLACFLWSPKDLEWHGASPARADFMLESLRLLREQLGALDIPLAVLTADERDQKCARVLEFIEDHDISHVYANIEYEVDELRRDIDFLEQLQERKRATSFQLFHDQTVVEPGTLTTGSGGPLKVFTPYHKAWLAKVAQDPSLLDLADAPTANDKKARTEFKALFEPRMPKLPASKEFASEADRARIRKLWPAGHKAAVARLADFLHNKVRDYKKSRSTPAANNSSRLSPYFAAGILSVREALGAARDANGGVDDFDAGDEGIGSWVREIVFREFYRQTLVTTPHDAMNLPHNLKFDFVEWEQDEEGWRRWCDGTTGVPFVDAGMRQLREEAYMHNRLRMNVSSYLSRNLLIDYRKGERFFAENLVDWDLSNNTQGWEPSYTVFNPVSQAERCDPKGEYIRKWVPELRHVDGKAVFDPFNRLDRKEFEKLGYPAPHVDYKESKDRCIQRYKQDMADADP